MLARMIDRKRLESLLEQERTRYADTHPRSAEAYTRGQRNLFGGVPMTWMNKAAGHFPLYLSGARGSRVTDIDGLEYVDFALGDTGAMAGHSPEPVVAAIQSRVQEHGGLTAMMPTDNAAWVGAELERRFGVSRWSFTLTASDANRWAIRLARQLTGRPKILVFAWCYHGSVDETFALPGPDGETISRPGNVGPPVPLAQTTRVVEYNDLDGLAQALAYGDVAAVLMEPALTNIGIVLPQPGYLEAVRELTRTNGALLINDETHTFSAGPGGATRAWDLEPDIVTIGKSIAGGIPVGAYGLDAALADRIDALDDIDLIDTGGVGGTLAGNALSIDATRATLEHVLTEVRVRIDGRARYPLHRRCPGRDRSQRRRVVGDAARCPRRIPVRATRTDIRKRVGRRRRRRARGLPAPAHGKSRGADHAVSQHGADVAGDDRCRRGPAHRAVRGSRAEAARQLTFLERAASPRRRRGHQGPATS